MGEGQSGQIVQKRIERMRPPPGYDEAVRSAGVVLGFMRRDPAILSMRAFEARVGGLDAFVPPHGGGNGVQWLGGTPRRPRPY